MTHSIVLRGVAASLLVLFLASAFASSGYGQSDTSRPRKVKVLIPNNRDVKKAVIVRNNNGNGLVMPRPRPDLVPQQPCYNWDGAAKKNVPVVWVSNQGEGDAPATTTRVDFYSNGTLVFTERGATPPIAAGQSAEVTAWYFATTDPIGAKYDLTKLKLKISVNINDSGKPIPESDTKNNVQIFDIYSCIQ